MKTFLDLTGAAYPKTYQRHAITPTTGISLAPSFAGKTSVGHETLFNEHFGARYARLGDWKLVSSGRGSTWNLFNMATDKAETQNVAAKYPEKVRQLQDLWHQWASTHAVFPKPGKRN